jgi:N-acetylglucosamine-6-phosphate deacetylase
MKGEEGNMCSTISEKVEATIVYDGFHVHNLFVSVLCPL